MAKKARLPINPTPAQQRPAWIGFAVTALIAAVCGAAISASIRPRTAPPKPAPVAAAPAQTSPQTTPTADPASNAMPTPDLVLGLPPAQVALNLGNWSYDRKNWNAAIVYYNEAAKRGFGSNPDVLTDLGNAYRFSNQPQKALAQYFLAQQKSPAHETSLFNQGGVYADDLGDTAKAITVWKQYLQRYPSGQHREEAKHLIEITQAHSGMNTGMAPAAPGQ